MMLISMSLSIIQSSVNHTSDILECFECTQHLGSLPRVMVSQKQGASFLISLHH